MLTILPGVPARALPARVLLRPTTQERAPEAAGPGVAPTTRLWRVARTTPAARRFAATVRATATGSDWLVLAVRVSGSGTARTVTRATMAEAGERTVSVYPGDGSATALCPGVASCGASPGEVVAQLDVDSDGKAVRDTWYVVTQDATAAVRVTVPGWSVRRVAATGLRRHTGPESDAAGVGTGAGAVERFAGVSAPGARHGSFAWGLLSCATAGVGTATLRAVPGPRPGDDATARCGGGSGGFAASASVGRATTWHFDGDAVGVGRQATRLLVWDFPRG